MREVIAAIAVLVVLALGAIPCSARDGDWTHGPPTPTGTIQGGTPIVRLVDSHDSVLVTYTGRHQGQSANRPVWTCRYYPATGNGGPLPGVDLADPIDVLEPGERAWLICDDQAGQQRYAELIQYDPANPLGGIAAADRALDEAENRIVLPTPAISTSPPLGSAQLVGIPTWLWIDDPWQPLTASASLGGVTATVTATPTKVVWSPGDGGASVACDGPGVAYEAGRPDRETTCSYTYTRRSTVEGADGTFALAATVTYEVAWQATTGEGGPLEPLTRTATVPVVVHEAQAVLR